ncbi:MAG: sigma-54 dependent transcriptional regulator [Pseudomonadales bacterium]
MPERKAEKTEDRKADRPAEKQALVVDDEPDIRELLEITLGRMGISTIAAADLSHARALLAERSFDLCLTDLQLPDGNGVDLVRFIGENHPQLPVAVITAFGSMDVAISALKAGAFDFLQKPVELEQLRALVDAALKLADVDDGSRETGTRLIGTSAVMDRLRSQIGKLARSQAPIYLSGESGSGKEVAARLIHEQGPRGEAPFVAVNCGAIPGELMESELFGHVKGSFTGAVADKQGLFQAAEGGTLFLDEVADLPLPMQVKLLRVIQEKAVRAVGSAQEHATDVRILCATHKDLANEVANGRFRQDLFYRLNVIELAIPSLRERRDDIPELAAQILERLSADYGEALPRIDADAMRALQQHRFPGNVRELENVLERAFTLCEGGTIRPSDLQLGPAAETPTPQAVAAPAAGLDDASADPAGAAPAPAVHLPAGESLESYLDKIERTLITEALEATRWNKTAAAKQLGITFRALRYRLKKLDLE